MDLGAALSAPEVEFLAEFDSIYITPNFQADPFQFIGGAVGPFIPQRPVEVPLWLALTLKSRHKCSIRPPEWLSVDFLRRKLDAETTNAQEFSDMPKRFLELSALLFQNALDDIREADLVRSLLMDIQDVRRSKIRRGLTALKDSAAVRLNNLTLMEINSIRPFFVQAMNTFYKMQEATDEAAS